MADRFCLAGWAFGLAGLFIAAVEYFFGIVVEVPATSLFLLLSVFLLQLGRSERGA